MIARKITGAFAALALAASPVAASAAQPLSLASNPELRAGASMDDADELRGRNGTLIAVGVVVAVVLILWLTDTWPFDDDDSDSP